jgi:hypothetical protein
MMTLRSIPALWLLAGAALAAQSGHNHYRWQNGWNSVEIETSGQIEFTDDDTDIKTLSTDGYFELEQRTHDGTKTLVATPARRTYSVNHSTRPFDADAKAWLALILPKYIRESAINAPARVQRILRQKGATAVLADIGKIESDGSRRIYLNELLRTGSLNAEDLREAMRQARKISSDGEKAALLMAVASNFRTPATREDYFYAVDTISSDGEHRRVLSSIIQSYGADREMIARSLRSAKRISSDGEKAGLLVEAAGQLLSDEARQNFFRAADSISSDGERHVVLSAIIRRDGQNKETLDRALHSAAMISSDGEKASILEDAAAYYKDDPALRRAFFDAVATISSDGEHRRVLDALLRRPGLGTETLRDLAHSTATISSDGEKGAVLTELAGLGVKDAAMREGFFNAASSISSDGERAQVLIAVLSRGNLDKQGALQLVATARGISSDGEKAKVFARVVESFGRDADVSAAVRRAAETLGSDGEYRRVMSLLAAR